MKAVSIKNQAGEKKRFQGLILLLTVLSVVVLCLAIQRYTAAFGDTLAQETEAYMLEIAQQVTLVMNDRVEANLKNLETDAVALGRMALQQRGQLVQFLQAEARRYGCSGLSLADANGIAVTDEDATRNVASCKHFLQALQGESAVSGLMTSGFNNTDCIEYAAPVWIDGQVAGVLLATYNLDDFRDIMQVSIFEGRGTATVIDRQGVVIISSRELDAYNIRYILQENTTVTPEAFQRFTDDLVNGVSGVFQFTLEGTPLINYYQPLGINDWSLFISAPTQPITEKTNLLLRGTAYIGVVVGVLVTGLMLLVLFVQHKSHETQEKLMFTDALTGGYSYAKFELEAKKRVAQMGPGYYAIVQLNLEKFKLINTTFGREQGNRLLRYIHATLAATLRQDELMARVNADRFCMLVQYETPEEMCFRLVSFIEQINRFNEGQATKYLLQFTMGACVVDVEMPDIDMLYERANFSRDHGVTIGDSRGRISFFNEVAREILLRETEIENCMEQALEHAEFEIYLQPKYELAGNTMGGAEALVRWNDPKRGLISPSEFIPLFEKNGFIVSLDLYVFRQVCEMQQRLWDNGTRCVPISVNLSRRHLEQLDFLEAYRSIYAGYTFPAALMEIELTESLVFNNMELLCNVIDEIHGIGFSCSMDDFGSGYSSLNLLKDIPVDILKLDRAFFQGNIEEDEKSRYVIETVIDLAAKLHMKTVSEGVETMEQVDYLRTVRCDMVQGYAFAKPMPQSRFIALLDAAVENV